MAEDATNGFRPVEIRRRTAEERLEHLLFEVAMLSSRMTLLESENEAYRLAIQSLENRLLAVERATPWKRPSTAKPPAKKKPWDRGI